jgi:uncharacterized protein YbjT (DUF2867 family)
MQPRKRHQPAGVAVVEVDYRQPESLAEAMSRAGKLMLISPYTHDQYNWPSTL